jgi:hypothetical protein
MRLWMRPLEAADLRAAAPRRPNHQQRVWRHAAPPLHSATPDASTTLQRDFKVKRCICGCKIFLPLTQQGKQPSQAAAHLHPRHTTNADKRFRELEAAVAA